MCGETEDWCPSLSKPTHPSNSQKLAPRTPLTTTDAGGRGRNAAGSHLRKPPVSCITHSLAQQHETATRIAVLDLWREPVERTSAPTTQSIGAPSLRPLARWTHGQRAASRAEPLRWVPHSRTARPRASASVLAGPRHPCRAGQRVHGRPSGGSSPASRPLPSPCRPPLGGRTGASERWQECGRRPPPPRSHSHPPPPVSLAPAEVSLGWLRQVGGLGWGHPARYASWNPGSWPQTPGSRPRCPPSLLRRPPTLVGAPAARQGPDLRLVVQVGPAGVRPHGQRARWRPRRPRGRGWKRHRPPRRVPRRRGRRSRASRAAAG